jgi:protein SCO1/2
MRADRLLFIGIGLFWLIVVILAIWLAPPGGAGALTRPGAQLILDGGIRASFALTDHNGREVTERAFTTRPTAWFFGFTQCPDICPTTLAQLTLLLDKLAGDAARLNVVFVTVDPERDPPEVLKQYLSAFDPRIVGLTGTRSAVDAMAKSFFIYQAKVKSPDGGYTMDHTATILLTDAKLRFQGTLDPHEDTDVQLQKLRRLVSRGAA